MIISSTHSFVSILYQWRLLACWPPLVVSYPELLHSLLRTMLCSELQEETILALRSQWWREIQKVRPKMDIMTVEIDETFSSTRMILRFKCVFMEAFSLIGFLLLSSVFWYGSGWRGYWTHHIRAAIGCCSQNSRELSCLVYWWKRIWIQGICLPPCHSTIHVPGRRFHQRQWHWWKVHLRWPIQWREL